MVQYLNVFVVICIFDHEVACHDGQGELDLDVRLSGSQRDLLGLVPHGWLVLQLNNGLDKIEIGNYKKLIKPCSKKNAVTISTMRCFFWWVATPSPYQLKDG